MSSATSFFSPKSSSPAFHIFLNTPGLHPLLESIVHRRPSSQAPGKCSPLAARTQHVQDGRHSLSVVHRWASPLSLFLCAGSSGMTRVHTASDRQYFVSIPIAWSTTFPSQRIKSTSYYNVKVFSDRLLALCYASPTWRPIGIQPVGRACSRRTLDRHRHLYYIT